MPRLSRAWVLIIVLVIGGPATAAVGNGPRVIVAGDHVGNAFLQRPNTRVYVQSNGREVRALKLRVKRTEAQKRESSLPSIPPSSMALIGGAMLVAGRMIRRRSTCRAATL